MEGKGARNMQEKRKKQLQATSLKLQAKTRILDSVHFSAEAAPKVGARPQRFSIIKAFHRVAA